MELVDDEEVETMVALYCGTSSNKNAPIQLFAELASVEATEYPTPLAETDVVGDDVYYSSDPVDYEVDSESDPDADEVPDDIDDEGVNEDENVNASSVGNQIRRIVIHNNPGAHMSRIDPDAARAAEFPEYPEIPHGYRMGVYSDPDELRVGQRFESKEECMFVIKRYSMNISVDYKRSAEGCNWRVRAAFMQKSQMWEIRKFVEPHTCTSTRMTEDHRKLDSKTICTCIMPMGWIAAMREHVPGTVIELQTRSYDGPNDQLQSRKRIFHRMFWTFDQCICAFPHCKPFVQ
ncbi:hypothetical protein V6Z11_D03G184700, partial [Gossypium hirsutum]